MLRPASEDSEHRSVVDSSFPVSSYSTQHLFIWFQTAILTASALIEGVEWDTLLPYLDPIVERLQLLNPAGNPALVRHYMQGQVITTLAMVADASEITFPNVSKCLRYGRPLLDNETYLIC